MMLVALALMIKHFWVNDKYFKIVYNAWRIGD